MNSRISPKTIAPDPMTLSFAVVETTLTRLWDHGWFDLTRFKVSGPLAERQRVGRVLAEFLRDPISYRSFCTSPDPWGNPNARGLHGPFPSATLAPEWFRPVSLDELQRRLAEILDDPDFEPPLSQAQRAPVEAWLESTRARGDDLVYLDAPDVPGVRVEWDVWLLFHEFVGFSPDREELIVAVIGYD